MTGKLTQAAGTTNMNLMAEMATIKDAKDGWQTLGNGMASDLSDPVQTIGNEAGIYGVSQGERIMGGPVFSYATFEYTDSILKLNQALTTATGWQAQAQGWVQAAASAS